MYYTLDCEFDGFGGELLSLALVREDNESLYLVYPQPDIYKDDWVHNHVAPILWSIPSPIPGMAYELECRVDGARKIAQFLKGDESPIIIADWPDDIKYFCQAIITGPGLMASINDIQFNMFRIDAYPTELKYAIRHNAWWDAKALMMKLKELKIV